MSNSVVMDGDPLDPEAALDAWMRLSSDRRTCYLKDQPDLTEEYLKRFARGRKPDPNWWPDAWLAAVAEASGIGLASFDSDFIQFSLTDFQHLS